MLLVRRLLQTFIVTLALFSATACGQQDAPAPESAAAGRENGGENGPSQIVSWYYYDQNNTDPQANERAGNFYLARAIEQFNEQFAGQYTWTNVPRDYNLVLDLVAAVQNNGDIPDVMRVQSSDMPIFILNNTVQDLTDFVQSAPWHDAIDPDALAVCTDPEGRIRCVPVSESPYVVFYWSDYFPDGFPTTPEALLARAEELKREGRYALTYWGSTSLDGEAAGRYFYQVISSFGGSYDDGNGNMLLNTPENIAAIEFMRSVVANGYSPESVFVGSFEEEAVFKTAEAAAFPTGFFIAYLYLSPLTAPDGTVYGTATSQDMEDAVDDGQIKIAPFVAPEGRVPGCHHDVFGFVIPNGAKNSEGAKAYINWVMDPANGVEWVRHAGGGVPVVDYLAADAAFDTEIYRQAAAADAASDCRPWFGSLRRIPEARSIITTTIFDLIKGNPSLDVAETLTRAQEEYNANN